MSDTGACHDNRTPARSTVSRSAARRSGAPGAAGRGRPAGGHLLPPALEPDDVRAAVPGRAAARHLQLHAGWRQRRPGHQGDQRPQPLHRHARPRERGLHRVPVDAVRHRRPRACSCCAPSCTPRSRHLVDVDDAVRLLRRVLAVVVRLQAVSLRPRPVADGRGAGAAVHAADVRLPADRELRGLLLSSRGILRHGRIPRAPAGRTRHGRGGAARRIAPHDDAAVRVAP